MGKQGERQPRTEWAGMTDWIQAKVKPRTKKRGRSEARKGEEVAKDRVGRNDRLSLGSGGEAKKREVKASTEAARD